ncbi:hypothetical protein D6833_13575, partial [Candidatus Parcubacteria bacterium]
MIICPQCGYEYEYDDSDTTCPLCTGRWETWELQFSAVALPRIQEQVGAWLAQAPPPLVIEIAASPNGVKVKLHAPPGKAQGVVRSWASMIHQQTRWKHIEEPFSPATSFMALKTRDHIPRLVAGEGDPFLAIGGQLVGQAQAGADTSLRIWILGVE